MKTLPMNTTTNTTMIKLILMTVVLSLALTATSANAGGYAYKDRRASPTVYDYARVLSAKPIIRYVTVTTPVKECWEDTEYYHVDERPRGIAGKTLFGALLGGVIGHRHQGSPMVRTGRGQALEQPRQFLHLAVATDGRHLETVGIPLHQVQSLRPDGSGGSEDHQPHG